MHVLISLSLSRDSPLPLMEYTQNVVHFVDCILSTSSSDDHVKDFVKAGGLPPLIALFALPALPLNFPSSSACSSVISACKAVLVHNTELKVHVQYVHVCISYAYIVHVQY